MRSVTEARGTPPLRVGNDVGVDVGNDVGVQPPGQERPGAGPAGLRSLPAKQHAPKARPSPATDRDRRPPWSRAGVAAPQTSGAIQSADRPGRYPTAVVVNRSQGDRCYSEPVAPVAIGELV